MMHQYTTVRARPYRRGVLRVTPNQHTGEAAAASVRCDMPVASGRRETVHHLVWYKSQLYSVGIVSKAMGPVP